MHSRELSLDTIPTTPTPAAYAFEDLGNTELPIHAHKEEITAAMLNNQFVVLISPTGTGKSTQALQYALEADFAPIYNTQPRRRAAVNVAARIIEELAESVGEEQARESIACHTGDGLDGRYDALAQVLTEGTLRVRNTYDPTTGSTRELWILDEVHEASAEMWMLMGIAKEKAAADPNFTVMVMTATANKFDTVDYLTNDMGVEPAVIELTGGTNYEIEHREESLSTTAREAVKAAIDIHENPDKYDGANTIQVFEAGKGEIQDTIDSILRQLPPEVRARTTVLPNHAKLTREAQRPVYEPFDGIKIVVQTNIGKTSMTIPGTAYVITSGKERTIVLDEEGIPGLEKVDSTQDDLIQEKGRGGRDCKSIFIHTRHAGDDFVAFDERELHPKPEILRINLDAVVMALAVQGQNIRDFDGNPMPTKQAIDRAMHRLQMLGAIDSKEEITRLGRRMAKYPVSPELQRSLVEAEQYSEQIRLSMAAMVAAAEVGGLRMFKSDGKMWERFTDETTSDLLAQLEIFIAIERRSVDSLAKQDLDVNNIIRAQKVYRKIAHHAHIDDIKPLRIPGPRERKILRDCVIRGFAHSAYLPQGEGLFKAINGALRLREISNRSVVSRNTHNAVVGRPFDIQIEKDGEPYRKPIIETVTEVPLREIGKYAVNLTRWVPIGFRLRGGKFVQLEEQVLGQRVLEKREVPAQPSPVLRAAVIDQVRARPGKNLIELYKIKRELEQLARRTKRPIPLLTNDAINNLIAEAAPNDVTSPGHVESNLRQIIAERQITLDAYLTPEQRAKILADSPDQINVEGYELQLRYSRGKPIAKRCTVEMLEGFEHEPTLADGRPIFFSHGGKTYTLPQLRKHLRFLGEL